MFQNQIPILKFGQRFWKSAKHLWRESVFILFLLIPPELKWCHCKNQTKRQMLTDLKGFKINLNGRQWMPDWGRSQLAFDTCITASWKSHKKGGLEPWVRKIPWRRAWQPTPVFLPGESPWTEEPGGLQSTWSQSWTWLKQISTHARKRDAERSARYVGRSPSSTYWSSARTTFTYWCRGAWKLTWILSQSFSAPGQW